MQPKPTGAGQLNALGSFAPAAREFGQLALWMAATLAGVVTSMLVARRNYFQSMQDMLGNRDGGRARRTRARRPRRDAALPMLADAIVGNTRRNIAQVLGLPRSAVYARRYIGQLPVVKILTAETWYYPLRQDGDLAMAVEFSDDVAHRVEFFHAPAPG